MLGVHSFIFHSKRKIQFSEKNSSLAVKFSLVVQEKKTFSNGYVTDMLILKTTNY